MTSPLEPEAFVRRPGTLFLDLPEPPVDPNFRPSTPTLNLDSMGPLDPDFKFNGLNLAGLGPLDPDFRSSVLNLESLGPISEGFEPPVAVKTISPGGSTH